MYTIQYDGVNESFTLYASTMGHCAELLVEHGMYMKAELPYKEWLYLLRLALGAREALFASPCCKLYVDGAGTFVLYEVFEDDSYDDYGDSYDMYDDLDGDLLYADYL